MKKFLLVFSLCLFPVSATFAQINSSNNSQLNTEETLVSPETRVDYHSLQKLLAAGQWRKANDKTERLMLQAANRESQGWLSGPTIANFPCADLNIIDRLWKQYSQGKFGFTSQFPIFIETGNQPGKLVDIDAYEKFGDRIGWRQQQEWIDFKENLTYSLDAPTGHLPNPRQEYQISGGRLAYVTLAQRMVTCKLVTLPKKVTPRSNENNPNSTNQPANINSPLNNDKK
jgi:hypothetical protein